MIYFLAAAAVALIARNLLAIATLPPDARQLVFFHLPAAITAIAAMVTGLAAGILFLRTRNLVFDALAVSATEVGLTFLAIHLATGAIWSRAASGIWWTWDARLTSALICWVLYAAYLILRRSVEEPSQRAIFAAIFSLFAFVDVPFAAVSMQHWRPKSTGFPPDWSLITLLQTAAMLLFAAALVTVRLWQEESQRELDYLRRTAHTV